MSILVGFVLSLFIFSYLVGDNPLYRLAVHLLVGVSAAYASLVVVKEVIAPLYSALRADPGSNWYWLIPILFAVFLTFKLTPRLAPLGKSAVALLVGVGGAVALVGAVAGTLWPQVAGIEGGLAGFSSALFTVLVLLAFQFTRPVVPGGGNSWAMPGGWQGRLRSLGRAVLVITLGAIFAGTLSTSLVLLSDRIGFYITRLGDALTTLLS